MFNMKILLLLALYQVTAGQPLEFMVIGDWGERFLPSQESVADAMAMYAGNNSVQFIISTGDNFYPNGVTSADDRLFDTLWRDIYDHDSLVDLPWYITVGNHDYNGEEWAQVNFSYVEERWILPNLWHKESFMAEDSTVDIFFVDSEALNKRENDYTVMMEWLEDELQASVADYKLAVGHRQIYSTGDYGPISGTLHSELRPILEDNGVDMYINGHDHSLQYITDMTYPEMTDYLLSASGGGLTYPYSEEAEIALHEEYNKEVLFFERTHGFIAFNIDNEGITTDYHDDTNGISLIYSHTRPKYAKH